ncbi:hypothetical protein Ahy_A07g033115 [Arachis hypogaea]|uniref:Transposase MuDR plant domain-containing protein n=1 Tax=Arachis hypogaea TaxID=3818 RepID=A0A445C8B2_ARAHY|nr:hypothetical protein Ahy_A07g033115 [Arachis hypogaea]
MIKLYVEFEKHMRLDVVDKELNIDEIRDIAWKEDNNNNEEEFEANFEINDGDETNNQMVQNEVNAVVNQHPFGEDNVVVEVSEISIQMEFGYRESMISGIKSYTISKGIDYTVYESVPQTFYTKYNGYDMIVDDIRPLVEAGPSIKVKSIIAEVQSRFNYNVSYRKAWLAKLKSGAKIFSD